jgi:hypothetical protein
MPERYITNRCVSEGDDLYIGNINADIVQEEAYPRMRNLLNEQGNVVAVAYINQDGTGRAVAKVSFPAGTRLTIAEES